MKRFVGALVVIIAFYGPACAAININIATKDDLTSLKGVGEKTAEDIIDYRKKNGPFKSVDDLQKVPGVTPALMKQIRMQISTSGASEIRKPTKTAPRSKTKASTTEATDPARGNGLKSNKGSKKIAEKFTAGTKAADKKVK